MKHLNENIINDINHNCADWVDISENYLLHEDFIRQYKDNVSWSHISYCQRLSEKFIREFQDKVDWGYISLCQALSEDFIREFQDKVDWEMISGHQNLNEPFIREFEHKVNWRGIASHQHMTTEFVKEFFHTKEFSDGIANNDFFKFKEETILYLMDNNYYINYKKLLFSDSKCMDVFTFSKETQKKILVGFINSGRVIHEYDFMFNLTDYMKELYQKYTMFI